MKRIYLSDQDLTEIPDNINKDIETLHLDNNKIQDLTPLKDLKNLKTLWLYNNQIQDLTPLKDLKNLKILWLHNNQIKDLTPLKDLKDLKYLWVYDNPDLYIIENSDEYRFIENIDYNDLNKLKIAPDTKLSRLLFRGKL